jgi:hypothetical protein
VDQEGTVKTIKYAVFNVACECNLVKTNTLYQARRKLWPATIVSEGALDKDDFTGFTVCNKDTLHEMVLMSENWTSQTLNVKSGRCERVDQCR